MSTSAPTPASQPPQKNFGGDATTATADDIRRLTATIIGPRNGPVGGITKGGGTE